MGGYDREPRRVGVGGGDSMMALRSGPGCVDARVRRP